MHVFISGKGQFAEPDGMFDDLGVTFENLMNSIK